MKSILVWKDGRRTEQDIVPGRDVLVRVAGSVVAFVRIGVERSMFVYEERETVSTLRSVPHEPETAS